MEPPILFTQLVIQGGTCVQDITPGQLSNATPCSQWNLRQLLNHLVYELLWVPDMLSGKTIAEVGDKYEGDVLGDDPQAAWNHAVKKATAAVQKADPAQTVHLSYGDIPAADYITEVASDVLIHSWDIDQSLQCSLQFDEPVVRAVYDYLTPRLEGYRKAGAMGLAITVSDEASLLHKLLGQSGRKPA